MAKDLQFIGVNSDLPTVINLINQNFKRLALERNPVTETWLQMHPQWTDSWTLLSTYQDVTGSLNSINFDACRS